MLFLIEQKRVQRQAEEREERLLLLEEKRASQLSREKSIDAFIRQEESLLDPNQPEPPSPEEAATTHPKRRARHRIACPMGDSHYVSLGALHPFRLTVENEHCVCHDCSREFSTATKVLVCKECGVARCDSCFQMFNCHSQASGIEVK